VKKDIHPKYYPEAKVVCACGNTWTTGSTQPEIRTEMCSVCHPFFTGEQRIVDTAGQVERFERRREIARQFRHEQEARDEARKARAEEGIFELVTEGQEAPKAEEAVGVEAALTEEQAAAMAEAMLEPSLAEE
jgi:large subunit ribosomal protein L31